MRSLSMQALANDFFRIYPGIVIYGVGDEAHKLRPSDHNVDDTPGSKPAQEDDDDIPEYRAIDVMLGRAFTRSQALAVIAEILADPENRARLRYINFLTMQWHMRNNFEQRPNTSDPHPTHIHFSGLASKDEIATRWLGVKTMRTASLYRHAVTGACVLREGGYNYGIATVPELQAIQRLVKAAGGDATLHDVSKEDWAVLQKTGATPTVTVNLAELAAAIIGHLTPK